MFLLYPDNEPLHIFQIFIYLRGYILCCQTISPFMKMVNNWIAQLGDAEF